MEQYKKVLLLIKRCNKINLELTNGQQVRFQTFQQFVNDCQDVKSPKNTTQANEEAFNQVQFFNRQKSKPQSFESRSEFWKLILKGINAQRIQTSYKNMVAKSRKQSSTRMQAQKKSTQELFEKHQQYYDALDHHVFAEELFPIVRLFFLAIDPKANQTRRKHSQKQIQCYYKFEMGLFAYFIILLRSLSKAEKINVGENLKKINGIKNNLMFNKNWLLLQSKQLINKYSENKLIFSLFQCEDSSQDVLRAALILLKLQYAYKMKPDSVAKYYNEISGDMQWLVSLMDISFFPKDKKNDCYLIRTKQEHFLQIVCIQKEEKQYWHHWQHFQEEVQKITWKYYKEVYILILKEASKITEIFINFKQFPQLFDSSDYYPCNNNDEEFSMKSYQMKKELQSANLIYTAICYQRKLICFFFYNCKQKEINDLLDQLMQKHIKQIKLRRTVFQIDSKSTTVMAILLKRQSLTLEGTRERQKCQEVAKDFIFHTLAHKLSQQKYAVDLSTRVPTFKILENIKGNITISSDMSREALKTYYFCLYVKRIQYLEVWTQSIDEMRVTYYVLDYLKKIDNSVWKHQELEYMENLEKRIKVARGQEQNLNSLEIERYLNNQKEFYCLFWGFFRINNKILTKKKHPNIDQILMRQGLLFQLINILPTNQQRSQIIRLEFCYAALFWGFSLKQKKQISQDKEEIFQHQIVRPYTIIANTIRCIIVDLEETFSKHNKTTKIKNRFCVIQPYTNRLRSLLYELHPKNIPYPSQTMEDLRRKQQNQEKLRCYHQQFYCKNCSLCKGKGENCYKQFMKLKQMTDIKYENKSEDIFIDLYIQKMQEIYFAEENNEADLFFGEEL